MIITKFKSKRSSRNYSNYFYVKPKILSPKVKSKQIKAADTQRKNAKQIKKKHAFSDL